MSSAHHATPADLDALREVRDEILALAEKRNATDVRVFGSIAKNASGPESDVDLLVRMAPGATLVDLIGLEHDIEALLGRKVDVLTENSIHPRLDQDVRSNAISL